MGIDPGKEGAVVILDAKGEPAGFFKVPVVKTGTKAEYDLQTLVGVVEKVKNLFDPKAVLEFVHSMPKQGVASTFSFGKGLGIWMGMLSAFRIPYTEVRPNSWKSIFFQAIPRDAKGKHSKEASILAANRAMPHCSYLYTKEKGKTDHNIADALMIAEYGRRYIYR